MSSDNYIEEILYVLEDPVISTKSIDDIMAYCYPNAFTSQKKLSNKQIYKMDFDYNEELDGPIVSTHDFLDWRKKAEGYRKECDNLKSLISKINEENQSLREEIQELKEELRDLNALLD
jgi:hypothetical protein